MSVTRKLLVIGLVILFLVGVNSQFVEAVDTIVRRKVGVVEFKGDVAEKYRQSAINILAKTLHDFGRFEVIDRTEMDRVLEEQKFQHSGLVDQSTAVEIGKLIAADIIAAGTVNNISVEKKDSKLGDYYDASASVTVKFINVESGRVLHIINNSITISESNREQAKQQALKYCFGHAFVVKLREKFSLHSRIKEIDGNIVYFFNGKQLGVKEGSRYKILAEEAGSEKLDLKGDNKLRKKIGVIEVIKVAEGISKGKIIWNSEEVETGDLIKEMISITNNQVKLEVSRRSVSLIERRNDGDTINKGALLYKLHYGWETPYQMESSFYGGLSLIKELNMFDLGFQVGKEFPLKYGKTYLSLKGNGGLAMARQRTGFILLNFLDADTAKFPYLGGSAGLKIYTNHKDVLRLEAGLNYQLGPSFSWNYGKYKTANCSGLGFYGAATIPFGQGAGKEKAMKFKDIDENLKKANQVLKTIEDIMDAF